LWAALEEKARASGEPIHHIARTALADYLQVAQHTLFQVSTTTALVEGIYRGAVTVAQLLQHGDLGLGTFEGIDGEMVILDGRCFQVRSDGKAHEAEPGASSPWAAVTHFHPDQALILAECPDLKTLCAHIDALRGSDNLFYALRIEGVFRLMHTRAMCKSAEGVPLATAAAHQPEFYLRDVAGTMVGFWSPEYVRTLEVPGYHLHFLSADRTAGGHVLGCAGADLRIQVQQVSELRVALPENPEFLRADLTRDPAAALNRAEKVQESRT
jgi:acetolactate decarboxylase